MIQSMLEKKLENLTSRLVKVSTERRLLISSAPSSDLSVATAMLIENEYIAL